ncbi:MAG: hypothetical protein J2P15_08025 [Micromonosporaceae bacterium]|nr:hypothetical protein [Micromonosporaceae bacterium]
MSQARDVDVDLVSLRRGGDSISDAATRLTDAWAAHANRVAGMGDIFGSDPIGGLIGASYHAAHAIAERSYQSVAASLESFNGALYGIAGAIDNRDAADNDAVKGLRRRIDDHPDSKPSR